MDIPTLEVMEESLKEFPGAVVLISHDRCLMDKVCTQILGLGVANEHQLFADYIQWEEAQEEKIIKKEVAPKADPVPVKKVQPKKLTYKEQRELEGMEEAIMKLETEIESLHKKSEEPQTHSDPQKSLECYKLLADAQHKLEGLFSRWQELVAKEKN